jgi:iron complex outermembrane receptor protein
MKRKFTLLIVLTLVINLSFSQTIKKDSLLLDEVVVTGSKIGVSHKMVPLSVSQISQKEIEKSGQMNILPALNTYAPGIFVTERNMLGFGVAGTAAGSITMRGISSAPNTDVLVLIDGNPQYQGIFGHPLSDAYVASDVEKVEIIHGPASILYGSNAMAGVINIITKKQHEDGLKVSLGGSYGSYNTQKYYGTIGYRKDKLSFFASVNHDQTDGTRANTDFDITNGYFKAGYEINKKFNLIADFSIAKFNANDNGSIYLPIPAPFNIDVTRGKASVSVDNKFEHSEGGLKIYHNFGNHVLSDGFQSTDRFSGAMLYQTFKLSTRTNVTVGADFKQYGGTVKNQPFLAVNDSLITVNELAVYAYAQQTLFEKLTVSAGVRLENNSKFGNELVPIGGLTYNLSDKTTFKASVSKGFRSPTIMEMYLYAPNPDLQPERMMNYEISWLQSLLNNKLNVELTAYKVKGDNLIQVVAPPFPAKRQNVGSFDNQGIEFSAKYAVCKDLFIYANYSYLNMSKVVIAAPRQQVNVSANYNYKIWNLNVSTQYIEKLYALNSSNPFSPVIVAVPNYFLLNSRLSARPLKQLEVFVAANNLLNQRYQINYGYPMSGINFNVGFNVKF